MEVAKIELPVSGVYRASLGGWSLVIAGSLLRRLGDLRGAKLPNETGGVLIGAYDLVRRIVYAVDTIASPPDSRERPTLYIRGCEGLAARVEEIVRRTDGQLEYIGEWHSHPDGHTCDSSDKDVNVFAWIRNHMADAGLPALMAIAGQGGRSRWFLDEITVWDERTCMP
jgi:integrative and conjugative element protein (TIGR02256 family)